MQAGTKLKFYVSYISRFARSNTIDRNRSVVDSTAMKENWEPVQRLFLEALDLPAEARASFLDSACAGDVEMRREVESLLAHDGEGRHVAEAIEGTAHSLFKSGLEPERKIGDYEVLKII